MLLRVVHVSARGSWQKKTPQISQPAGRSTASARATSQAAQGRNGGIIFFLCDWSLITLMSLDSPTVVLICTCLRTRRATQTLQLWFGSWRSAPRCKTRRTSSTSFTSWSTDMTPTHTVVDVLPLIHTMMFDISAEQRSRLAGGVVGSRAGRSQCSLLAGGVVCAGWSVQRVGTHQIHLWHTTQEGGGLGRGESRSW